MAHEIPSVERGAAGPLLDGLLTRVARGRGAVDVALGEGLAALAEGDRVLRLGFSGIGDYARERLGIAGRTAQAMARLARELRSRPVLAAAVRGGEDSARKALAVLPTARGEEEAAWVARARTETVRALEEAVRAGGVGVAEEEAWDRVWVATSPEARSALDEAMALAGKLLGATAPQWQRLEVICQEFLGTFPQPASAEDAPEGVLHTPVSGWLEAAKRALEDETTWAFLDAVEPVATPASPVEPDPIRLDLDLRRLAGLRARWDEVLGHLAMLVRMLGLWRDMKFASFGHYCAERLGISTRAVEQRVWLERKLYELPALRAALRGGRVSYEKARLVAGVADEATAGTWIARAEQLTCVALRREIEAGERAQMCARPDLDLRLPRRVTDLLIAAFRAARAASDRWLTPSQCLERVAAHFVTTWKEGSPERRTLHHQVLDRDRGLCQVPGCSRAAMHAHHIRYRSRGGSDDPTNLVSLCAGHHLHGVHRGFVRVEGRAPDRLRWRLGCEGGSANA